MSLHIRTNADDESTKFRTRLCYLTLTLANFAIQLCKKLQVLIAERGVGSRSCLLTLKLKHHGSSDENKAWK